MVALMGVGLISVGARRPLTGEAPPFSYGVMLTGGAPRDPVRVFAPLPAAVLNRLPAAVGREVTVLAGDVVARIKAEVPLWPGLSLPQSAGANQAPAREMTTLPAEVLVVRVPLATWQYRFQELLSAGHLPSHPGPFFVRGAGIGEWAKPADLARSLGLKETPGQTWPTATLTPQARLLRSLVFVNNMALPPERRPPDDQPNLLLLTPTHPLHLTDLLPAVQAAVGEAPGVQVTALGARLPFGTFALLWFGQGVLLLGGGLLVMSLIFGYADELAPENWLSRQWHACAVALSERWVLYLLLLIWTTLLFQAVELLVYFLPDLHGPLALIAHLAGPDFPGAKALHHLQIILVFVFALSAVIPSVGVLTGLVYVGHALWVAPVNDLPLRTLLLTGGNVILEMQVYVIAMLGACCVVEGLFAPQHFDATDHHAGYLEGLRAMFRFLWLIGLLLLIATGYEAIGSLVGG
jgi:hypothetical protein